MDPRTFAVEPEMTAKIARTAMPVAKMTALIVTALETPKPKARYVLLKLDSRFGGWWLARFAPTRWFDRQVAKLLNLRPSALQKQNRATDRHR